MANLPVFVLALAAVLGFSAAALVQEPEAYRNRTNTTFSPEHQKSLFHVVAPSSPDIKTSYYLPDYHDKPQVGI